MTADRYVCTPEAPYTPERAAPFGGRVAHRDAIEIGKQQPGWPYGDIVTLRCLACGTEWRQELPQ